MDRFCPENREDWRDWLRKNHLTQDSIWLIFYRQSSPSANLSWSEAVDEALCFGWIDSTKKTIDDEQYIQYFCKRKPKSNWSKVNKDKVEILIAEGRMEEAGYKSIEIARENGSWTYLDQVEALIVPEDLQDELARHPGASEYFDSLSKSSKKILLYWVLSGKREATRRKRIVEIAENASQQLMPKQFR
ncbi:MAG: YdeI/OmpD-associated family protein [Bacteroidia bacterium]